MRRATCTCQTATRTDIDGNVVSLQPRETAALTACVGARACPPESGMLAIGRRIVGLVVGCAIAAIAFLSRR
jgi:hypothetical protein